MIITTLYGLVTLALIIAFMMLCVWAYSPRRHENFIEHANIPFKDDGMSDSSRSV